MHTTCACPNSMTCPPQPDNSLIVCCSPVISRLRSENSRIIRANPKRRGGCMGVDTGSRRIHLRDGGRRWIRTGRRFESAPGKPDKAVRGGCMGGISLVERAMNTLRELGRSLGTSVACRIHRLQAVERDGGRRWIRTGRRFESAPGKGQGVRGAGRNLSGRTSYEHAPGAWPRGSGRLRIEAAGSTHSRSLYS